MNYIITYKKIKTISLRIIDENTVKVSAPTFISKERVDVFIKSKQKWVTSKVNQIIKAKNKFYDVIYGGKVIIFGEFVEVLGDKNDYLRGKATNYLPKRIEYLSNLYNFKYNSVKVKNYKSKWGQCDHKGNISLNSKLIMLPIEVIDYVIIHELCHTLFMSHSKSFHEKLSSYFKKEKSIIKELKEYSILLKCKF